jgi:uncharacterized protein (TIGR03437 family)
VSVLEPIGPSKPSILLIVPNSDPCLLGKLRLLPTEESAGCAQLPAGNGDQSRKYHEYVANSNQRNSIQKYLITNTKCDMIRSMPNRILPLLFLSCALAAAQAQILDDFTKDASLDTAIWTTSTPTLQRLATAYVNGTANGTTTFVPPQVTFSTSGMVFAGVNGAFLMAGIQSRQAFTPPFAVQATVQAIESHGRPAALYLATADAAKVVGAEIYSNSVAVSSTASVPANLATQSTVGVWYTLSISIDAAGIAIVEALDESGALIRSSGAINFGMNPLYLVMAQVEGIPADGVTGANRAVWQRIKASTTSAPPQLDGVLSASAFGGFTSVSPGSWIEIYGSNLAATTRSWGSSDFKGINAPTSLEGTFVTIGGQSAFIDFISPGQVNALVPSNAGTGLQPITVTTGAGMSAPFNINVNAAQPGLLAPPSFAINGKQYAVALFPDGTYVLPAGAIAGVTSRPAKPGETIVLYGVGFGPVTPAIPAGQLVQQANALTSGLQMFLGGILATASYAGLAPNYTGLYQFNVIVPNVATGDVPLTFTLNAVSGTQKLFIAVGN